MRAVYFETLKRIEHSGPEGYDVFTARVRVARPRQAAIAAEDSGSGPRRALRCRRG